MVPSTTTTTTTKCAGCSFRRNKCRSFFLDFLSYPACFLSSGSPQDTGTKLLKLQNLAAARTILRSVSGMYATLKVCVYRQNFFFQTCAVEQQATLYSYDFRRNFLNFLKFLNFSDRLVLFDRELEDQ